MQARTATTLRRTADGIDTSTLSRGTRPEPALQLAFLSREAYMTTSHLGWAMVGLTGGLIGASAMNVFARLAARAGDGREARGAAPGADRADRGVQPPQAHGSAEEDAPILVGRTIARRVTGREPSRQARLWLGTGAHMAFGASVGLAYALLSAWMPTVRTGYGLLYGTAVWAAADEGVMPALGLSRRADQLSPGIHAFALAGHIVYAATLETVLRVGAALTRRSNGLTARAEAPARRGRYSSAGP